MKVIIIFLLIICAACKPSRMGNTNAVADLPNNYYRYQIIGGDTLNILREVYIVDRDGAKIYSENEEGEAELSCIRFGEPVYVYSERDSLVGVAPIGERDNIYYILKSATGSETDIPLTNDDLNKEFDEHEHAYDRIKVYNCNNDISYNIEQIAADTSRYPDVEVSLIALKEFKKMKKTAAKHLVFNNAVLKTDSVISIGTVKFEDGRGEGNMPNTYEYVGEYSFLDSYLLRYICEACEEYTYFLIDKKTGREISSFNDIPYFSPDKSLALTLGQLFSDHPTLLYITKWKAQEPAYIHKEFGSWVPVGEGFWGIDNCFYTAVIPFVTSDKYNNNYEQRLKEHYNFRYLKIKIKGPTPDKEMD
jgi:hypothetical protein